jgi:hypothetical protein
MKKADFLKQIGSDEGVLFRPESPMRLGIQSHRRSVRGALTSALDECLSSNEEIRYGFQNFVERDAKGSLELYLVLRRHVAKATLTYEVDLRSDVVATIAINITLWFLGGDTVVNTVFKNSGAGMTPDNVSVSVTGGPKNITISATARTATEAALFGAAIAEATTA